MAKMSGGVSPHSGPSWSSFLKDNTPSSSENVRNEKRRKSGDMHTKLTLEDKPLLGDMPKVEEFSTVCCKLCKFPVKTQYVKEHMALRHPDYSAARLREEAERFQVKIMINSIPNLLLPSHRSHLLAPVRLTSPVPPCAADAGGPEAADVGDIYPSLSQVAVKEEAAEQKRHSLVDDPEVVSSEEQLGAVLSLNTEVPGAFVDILEEFESDAGGRDKAAPPPPPPAASPVADALPEVEFPLAASPSPPAAAPLLPPPPPPPPPPAAAASGVPSKVEPKSAPLPPPAVAPAARSLSSDASDASCINEHLAKIRGTLCSRKNRLGHLPRLYDPKKHCGVWIADRSKHCTRVLDCRQHNLDQKSKVLRPTPFKDLLVRFKAGKSRERETIKPMTMRYDPKFVPPEGHPASSLASPAVPGPPGMVTYHNITNSPAARRERPTSADGDGMPPPAVVPARAAPSRPPADASVPRVPTYPQPLAVSGAACLFNRGGCLALVDGSSQLRGAFRSLFQPVRRGQQSLLKVNQTRPAGTAPANGQLTTAKRPPEPSLGVAPPAKKARAAAGAAPTPARPPSAVGPLTVQLQSSAAVSAVLSVADGTGIGPARQLQQQQHPRPQQLLQQQLEPHQLYQPRTQQQQQAATALLNVQPASRGVSLAQMGLQPQQLSIQLPKGGLSSNIRLTLPSAALSSLQGISNDTRMIAINSSKVPINRMGQGAGGVSLGQRVARIGAPSTLPVHLQQQVLGQIQIPRLPNSAGGLTFKVQPQGGLVMRPEQL